MIRLAEKEDVYKISRIHVDGWRYAYKGILEDKFLKNKSYEEQCEKWNDRYFNNKNTTEVLFIFEDTNGEALGFISLDTESKNSDVEGSIGTLYVDENYHHQGIGTELFNRALEVLKENGAKFVKVTAFKDNKQACSFYEKLGGQIYEEKIAKIGGIEVKGVTYKFKIA